MVQPCRRFRTGVPAAVVPFLVAGSGTVEAQPASRDRTRTHFIRTKSYALNLDHIDRVDFGVTGSGKASAWVFFTGNRDPLSLVGEDAEQLRAAFEDRSSGHI